MRREGPLKNGRGKSPSFHHGNPETWAEGQSLDWFQNELGSMVRQLKRVRSNVDQKREVDSSLKEAMKEVNKQVEDFTSFTSTMYQSVSPAYQTRPWPLYKQDEGWHYLVPAEPSASSHEVPAFNNAQYGFSMGSGDQPSQHSANPPRVPLGTLTGTMHHGGRPEVILDFARPVNDVAIEAICNSRVNLMDITGNSSAQAERRTPAAPQRQKRPGPKPSPRPNGARIQSLYIPDLLKPSRTKVGNGVPDGIEPSRSVRGEFLVEVARITPLAPELDDFFLEFQISSSSAMPKVFPAKPGEGSGECLVMEVLDAWHDRVVVTLSEGSPCSPELGRLSPPPWERAQYSVDWTGAPSYGNASCYTVSKLNVQIRDFAHGAAEGLEWTVDGVCVVSLRVAFFKQNAPLAPKAMKSPQQEQADYPARFNRKQRQTAAGSPSKAAHALRNSSSESTSQGQEPAAGVSSLEKSTVYSDINIEASMVCVETWLGLEGMNWEERAQLVESSLSLSSCSIVTASGPSASPSRPASQLEHRKMSGQPDRDDYHRASGADHGSRDGMIGDIAARAKSALKAGIRSGKLEELLVIHLSKGDEGEKGLGIFDISGRKPEKKKAIDTGS